MDTHRIGKCVVSFSLAISSAIASTANYGQQVRADKCSVGTTLQMKECTHQEYKAAEERLQTGLRSLVQKIKANVMPERVEWLIRELKKTQERWEAYRNAECEFQRSVLGEGTLAGLAYVSCMQSLTEARAQHVELTATTWGAN